MFKKDCQWSEEKITAEAERLLAKMNLKEKVMFLSGDWKMLRDSIVYKRTYNPVPITSHGCKPGCGVTIKHYAANNQEYNRYGNNSLVSERAMREIYLRGFAICIRESRPRALMTSYNLLNGIHTAERRDLLQDILRCEFGFRGLVMTDWWASSALLSKEDTHPQVQPHLVAAAGGDLFMPGSKADYEDMLKGLQDGSLTRRQLEVNATRVARIARCSELYQDPIRAGRSARLPGGCGADADGL